MQGDKDAISGVVRNRFRRVVDVADIASIGPVDGSECFVPFCRAEPFDSPIELEEHRHAAHPELYE